MKQKNLFFFFALTLLSVCSACNQNGQDDLIPSDITSKYLREPWKEVISLDSLNCEIDAEITTTDTIIHPVYQVINKPFHTVDLAALANSSSNIGIIADSLKLNTDTLISVSEEYEIVLSCYSDYICFSTFPKGMIQLEDWVKNGSEALNEPFGKTIDNISISLNDAINNVEKILEEMQITHLAIAEVDKARILNDIEGTIPNIISEGWYIVYSRNSGDYIPIDIMRYNENGRMKFNPTNNIAPWYPETMRFYVDHKGIQYIDWSSRIEIVKTIYEDVPLLSIDLIKEQIRKYVKEGYAGQLVDSMEQPKIVRVILTNVLLTVDNEPSCGELVPAWIVMFTNKSYEKLHAGNYFLAINAVTGERVSPTIIPSNAN